jgi:hypothetical protein
MAKPHMRADLIPNLDFGDPIIFFDTHPEEQESYLYSYYSSLKTQLTIAWTGVVPKPLLPGKLRVVWWTVSAPPSILSAFPLFPSQLLLARKIHVT